MEPIVCITEDGVLVVRRKGLDVLWARSMGDQEFDQEEALQILFEALGDDSFELRVE